MRNKVIILGLCAAALATSVFATEAQAKFTRHNGNACTTTGDHRVTSDGTVLSPILVKGWNQPPTGVDVPMYCPLYDHSDYSKAEVSGINVHVYDGPGTAMVYAKVCTTKWNVLGGSCGNWAATPYDATGDYTLQPPLTALSNDGDFAYLSVVLPANSELKGFYTHD